MFNIVGEVSKVLFGTLDEADAQFYEKHIDKLETEQKDFLRLAKEQMLIVKSTLGSINKTILDYTVNEQIMVNSLTKLQHQLNENLKLEEGALRLSNIRLSIDEHVNKVET